MTHEALIIVDAQRGFIPTDQRHTENNGYGELAVPGGHEIIHHVVGAAAECALRGISIVTTQDWHPTTTAHFASEGESPNFSTTWPRHCVANTLGAELDEDLLLPSAVIPFHKGMEVLERGEDDTSYSGFNARNPLTNDSLPEWLGDHGIQKLLVVGLALDYCVKATALDGARTGFDVSVALNATRSVALESGENAVAELSEAGVELTTTKQWLSHVAAE
jgi:nicotinamidase/pyrazinamidase